MLGLQRLRRLGGLSRPSRLSGLGRFGRLSLIPLLVRGLRILYGNYQLLDDNGLQLAGLLVDHRSHRGFHGFGSTGIAVLGRQLRLRCLQLLLGSLKLRLCRGHFVRGVVQ